MESEENKQSLEEAFTQLVRDVERAAGPVLDDLVRNDTFLSVSGGFWNTFFGARSGIREAQEALSRVLNSPTKSSQDQILYKLTSIELRLSRIERRLGANDRPGS